MRKPDAPCLRCESRSVGCHRTCEKYILYKSNAQEYFRKIQEEKMKAKSADVFQITQAEKRRDEYM